ILLARSIVKRLTAAARSAEFLNAYPAGYLDALGLKRRPSKAPDVVIPPQAIRRIKPSATTLAFTAGGIELRTFDDLRAHLALTNDLDGVRARERGFDAPERSADRAAEIFWAVAGERDFAMFEHYLADEAGHARDFALAEHAIA